MVLSYRYFALLSRFLSGGGDNLSTSAGMSSAYYSYPDASDEECIQVIHRALELGINHLDTSDAYGPHTNERLVGEWPCISRSPSPMMTHSTIANVHDLGVSKLIPGEFLWNAFPTQSSCVQQGKLSLASVTSMTLPRSLEQRGMLERAQRCERQDSDVSHLGGEPCPKPSCRHATDVTAFSCAFA